MSTDTTGFEIDGGLRRTVTRPTRSWFGGIGLLGTLAAFGVFVPLPDVLLALALVPVWVLTPAIYTVALGHVILLPIATGLAGPELLAVELGLLAVLLGPAFAAERTWTLIAAAVVLFGTLLLAVAVTLQLVDVIWPAAVVFANLALLAAYLVHRYELVRLGMIEGDRR
jgi:hypothetical protein